MTSLNLKGVITLNTRTEQGSGLAERQKFAVRICLKVCALTQSNELQVLVASSLVQSKCLLGVTTYVHKEGMHWACNSTRRHQMLTSFTDQLSPLK